MTMLEIVVLAIVQGLTEFLPISSSAHLILPSQVLGWQDQGLAFDVAVHVGTLAAVVQYFRREVKTMAVAWTGSVFKQQHNQDSKLAWWIILGTIPAGLFGLLGKEFIETYLRSGYVIATTTIIFGLLLWVSDRMAKQQVTEYQLGWKAVLLIGLAQAIALIPGTSRSGITMTAGLFLGMTRQAAARFSFLLSIPLIFLAGSYLSLKLATSDHVVDWFSMLVGAGLAYISALICITFFLKVIERMGMLPFVIYRVFLGIALFIVLS